MGRRGIAVEADGAGGLEDEAEFDGAEGHHAQVGEHVGAAEEVVEAFEALGDAGVGGAEDLGVFGGGFDVPGPGVLEGLDLGVGLGAVFFGDEDVVVGVGIEGRIEIDQIDGFIFDVAAEDFEVVAVIEGVGRLVGHGG